MVGRALRLWADSVREELWKALVGSDSRRRGNIFGNLTSVPEYKTELKRLSGFELIYLAPLSWRGASMGLFSRSRTSAHLAGGLNRI